MKKEIILLCSLLIALSAISAVQADILISPPSTAYSLGDTINVAADASKAEQFQGFFRMSMICNGTETLMYFSPIQLEGNREKTVSLKWPVSKALGSCYISASLEQDNSSIEDSKTSEFELSDIINLNISLNKEGEFLPYDELKATGTAVLANGKNAGGIATILFDGKERNSQVSNGKISLVEMLAADIAPGKHNISIVVRDNNNNSGNANIEFDVATIPTALVIETDNESLLPGEPLVITPRILDQANGTIIENVDIEIVAPKEKLIEKEKVLTEEIVTSGNNTLFTSSRGAAPGIYTIRGSALDFETEKNVVIMVYEKLNTSIENDTLYVDNIGNARWTKPLEVRFKIENQTTTKIIELDLGVGENQSFKLEAPKGTYDIEVAAGNETSIFSSIPLTGDIVMTIELKPKRSPFERSYMLVLAAMALVVILYFSIKKGNARSRARAQFREYKSNYEAKHGKNAKYAKYKKINPALIAPAPKFSVDKYNSSDSTVKKMFMNHSQKLAASSIISGPVHGTKQEITALSITIPNLDERKENLDSYFASVLEKIKAHQGVADLHGNSIIALFNVVKQVRHDMAAVKAAQEIREISSKAGFNFKAGINTGLVIATAIGADKSVKYTSIDDTVAIARALAKKARESEILLSESVHKSVGSAVNAKKIMPYHINDKEAVEVYSLDNSSPIAMPSKDDYQWYIDRALGKGRHKK